MTMINERLAEVDRRIDDLEAGMGLRRSDQRQSVRRHVEALRQGRRTPRQRHATLPTRSASGSRVCDRGWRWPSGRSTPTWHRTARSITAAVEAELRGWNAFAERLQATAAAKTGTARDRAETGIKELRRRRLAVTERLDDLRDAPQEAWREHQERVTAARDDLERMADDLSASLY